MPEKPQRPTLRVEIDDTAAERLALIGDRYTLPEFFSASVTSDDLLVDVEIEVQVVGTPPRAVCRSVKCTQRDGGAVVTSEILRSIPVARILKWATEAAVRDVEIDDDGRFSAFPLPTDVMEGAELDDGSTWPGSVGEFQRLFKPRASSDRRWKVTDEFLAEVADIYRKASTGLGTTRPAPTAAVAHHFGRSRTQASRWIDEARSRGLLGPAIGPMAGEGPMKRKGKQR